MQKTVLISGANSGMGLATALLLAQRGYHVFAGARSDEGLATIRREAEAKGIRITPLGLNVQDNDSVATAVDRGCVKTH